MKSHEYLYTYITTNECTRTIAEIHVAFLYTHRNWAAMCVGLRRHLQHSTSSPFPFRLSQRKNASIVELDDKYGPFVNIIGFDKSLYKYIKIWLNSIHINHVKHTLRVLNLALYEQVNFSLFSHRLDYRCCIISLTDVYNVSKRFNPFDILGGEDLEQWLQNGCLIESLLEQRDLYVLKSLYKSSEQAFIWMFDQLRVRCFPTQDERLLLLWETFLEIGVNDSIWHFNA